MTASTPSSSAGLDGRRDSFSIELRDDNRSYRCVRVFGAPPERVFTAFTDPNDLRGWFPSAAPEGSELTVCESDPVEGGRYHYAMTVPGFGPMSWHGTYTAVDRPHRLDADEWFVMGDGDPDGEPALQTLTFEPIDDGFTRMSMHVATPEPEDPETFLEQAGAGLAASFATLDALVSG